MDKAKLVRDSLTKIGFPQLFDEVIEESGSGAKIPVIDVLTPSTDIMASIPLLIDKLNEIDYKTPGNILVRFYNTKIHTI